MGGAAVTELFDYVAEKIDRDYASLQRADMAEDLSDHLPYLKNRLVVYSSASLRVFTAWMTAVGSRAKIRIVRS